MSEPHDLTPWLRAVQAGDAGAREALFAAAYPELCRLARARLRDGGRNTLLDTTALVHESYLRYLSGADLLASERPAFFAYVSQVMRSVIVDTVRQREALRRGGDLQRVTLDTQLGEQLGEQLGGGAAEILQVHQALERLAAAEPRLAQVVEMRYFGGYAEVDIAAALGLTERTVRRDWDKARLLLLALLGET